MTNPEPGKQDDTNDPEHVPGGGADPDDLHDGSGPTPDPTTGGDDDQFQG